MGAVAPIPRRASGPAPGHHQAQRPPHPKASPSSPSVGLIRLRLTLRAALRAVCLAALGCRTHLRLDQAGPQSTSASASSSLFSVTHHSVQVRPHLPFVDTDDFWLVVLVLRLVVHGWLAPSAFLSRHSVRKTGASSAKLCFVVAVSFEGHKAKINLAPGCQAWAEESAKVLADLSSHPRSGGLFHRLQRISQTAFMVWLQMAAALKVTPPTLPRSGGPARRNLPWCSASRSCCR